MVIDRYTKIALTVIAVALVWLCIRPSWQVAEARTTQSAPIGPNLTQVDVGGKKVWAQVVWIANNSINTDGIVSVVGTPTMKLDTSTPMKVEVENSNRNPIEVKMNYPSIPLPVNVQNTPFVHIEGTPEFQIHAPIGGLSVKIEDIDNKVEIKNSIRNPLWVKGVP